MTRQMTAVWWLTSGESAVWAGPWPVALVESGTGPRPGWRYLLLPATRPHSDASEFRCVAVDRHADGPTEPTQGNPIQVAVWSRPEALATWSVGTFAPPRQDPDAWCTLCVTEAEAGVIAAHTLASDGGTR